MKLPGEIVRDGAVAGLVGMAAFACLSGPPGTSPDGLFAVAAARAWALGESAPPGWDTWPPLFALAAVVAPPLWVNLLAAGSVTGAAFVTGASLVEPRGARAAGLLAAALWLSNIAAIEHAAILDARPLFWALCAWSLASLARGQHALALGLAALAPLARPEGLALPVLMGIVSWVSLGWRGGLGGACALVPAVLWRVTHPGTGWEALMAPWWGTWHPDMQLALLGRAPSPTAFREFALAELVAGRVAMPSLLTFLDGPQFGFNLLGLAAAALVPGSLALLWLARRGVADLSLGLAPVVAMLALPMTIGQATGAANFLVFAAVAAGPAGAALVAWVLSRHRYPSMVQLATPAALAVALTLLTRLFPGAERPAFIEDGPAYQGAAAALRAAPPRCVQAGWGGSAVARMAGLVPRRLPGRWDPPELLDCALLLASDDVLDPGGSVGDQVFDQALQVVWVVTDNGEPPAPGVRWVALLHPTGVP